MHHFGGNDVMKIMQVNCVYKNGSTGKIVHDIHTELQIRGMESIVCYGRGNTVNEPYAYKICGNLYGKIQAFITRITGIMYGGCFFSTYKLISIIKKEKPDIVHLHCINSHFVNIYRLVTWLKKNNIATVLTLHAEFMYTGGCGHSIFCQKWNNQQGCGYCPRWRAETKSWFFDRTHTMWKRMKKSFEGFDTKNLMVVSVSSWLEQRAKSSRILSAFQHEIVLNGLDTQVFCPTDFLALKSELGLTNEKLIFHATPSFSDDPNHIKGGYYVIELAKRLECENIKIIVAGSVNISSMLPSNIITLGKISDQKLLAAYYSMADATLLTSQRETFSMICAESLCCGTPIVGFKAGAPEMISLSEYSEFVEHGDMDNLQKSVIKWVNNKKSDPNEIALKACEFYSKGDMYERYLEIYEASLNNKI